VSTARARRPPGWLLPAAGCALYTVVWYWNAWIEDDPYITFRTIEQLFAGNGLRYNVHERVQAFTHPLWLGLLLPFRALGLAAPQAAFLLGWGFALTTLGLLWRLTRREPARWLFALTALAISRVLSDWSSSGLETALSMALLVGFVAWLAERDEACLRATPLVVPFLLLSALLLTRHDHLPLVAPSLALLAASRFSSAGWRAAREALVGLAPFAAWTLFASVYYGYPFPNTALAKLGAAVPRDELLAQGGRYFLYTAAWDPLWLPLLAGGVLTAVRGGRLERVLGAGMALHFVYVAAIGGDFMLGRFWLPATAVALALAAARLPARPLAAAAGGILLFGLLWPESALRGGGRPRAVMKGRSEGTAGIVDARRELPKAAQLRDLRAAGWPRAASLPAGPPRVIWAMGRNGYEAALGQVLVDQLGLTDPFIARLPYEPPWQIGHFRRWIPDGYLASVASGENRLADPALAALYDDVRRVVSDPLFAPARLRAAWRLARRGRPAPIAERRCRGLTLAVLSSEEAGGGRSLARPTIELDGARLRLRGTTFAGELADRWQLAIVLDPKPRTATLRCRTPATLALIEYEVEVDYASPAEAARAAASAPRAELAARPPEGASPAREP
jgi:arabinofuranosyltransferase